MSAPTPPNHPPQQCPRGTPRCPSCKSEWRWRPDGRSDECCHRYVWGDPPSKVVQLRPAPLPDPGGTNNA